MSLMVVVSKAEVAMKISDQGGGLERQRQVFSFQKSQATSPGLPSARVAARYLGGDLSLASLTGLATDAVLHLKTKPTDIIERFP